MRIAAHRFVLRTGSFQISRQLVFYFSALPTSPSSSTSKTKLSAYAYLTPLNLAIIANTLRAESYYLVATKNLGDSGMRYRNITPTRLKMRFGICRGTHLSLT